MKIVKQLDNVGFESIVRGNEIRYYWLDDNGTNYSVDRPDLPDKELTLYCRIPNWGSVETTIRRLADGQIVVVRNW